MYKIFRQLTTHQVEKASKKIIGLHFFFSPSVWHLLDASNNFLDVQAGFALANVKVHGIPSLIEFMLRTRLGKVEAWSQFIFYTKVFF